MDEKMHLPRHEGQAAYFIPPIQNFHAGPAGMKYQPGTALGEDTRGHFFISEFPGTPARARIWAVKMAPDGAGFKMEKERQILQGVLVSGMDFGPDGGLYLADWIEGWGAKDYGRIWKLDVAPHLRHPLRQTTQKLLGSNFSDKSLDSLGLLLGYPDQRVRQEAQFALVEKGEAGADMLMSHVQQSQNQMARIHGLWGWWQLSRRKLERAKELLPFLTDQDPEIRAQTANILGDVGYTEAGPKLLSMMADSSQRVQFFVAQALGKIQHQEAFENLVALLAQNNDEDVYLRHAATLALARLGQEAPLVALATHENEAIRLGAVLALRRMKAAGIQAFLDDENMYIVAEAVRAIHDDYSIPEAMPKLARMLARTDIEGEVMLRRIISANQRLGRGEDWRRLIAYTRRTDQPMAMREEAMACLETWGQPSVLDRVDGRYRGEVKREVNELKEALPTVLTNLLQDRDALMRTAAAKVAGRLELTSLSEEVFQQYQRERKPEAKQAFLISLHQLGHPQTAEIVQAALDSRVRGLRARAVTLLPDLKIPPERIVNLAMGIISRGNPEEQQAALEAIGAIPATYTAAAFEDLMEKYEAGEIHPAVWLEWEEIVEASGSAAIKSRLTAFRQQKVTEGTLGEFYVSQQGGDVQEGRDIFWGHEAAQCTKCHKIGGTGSEVGPSLKGIGSRHEAAYLLESLVNPNAVIAPGYGVVSLIMKDGKTVVGFLESEDDQQIKLTVSDNLTVIAKAEVDQRIDAMSSMLNMGDVLSKREIRDLVAFLGSLK
ncbi:MAG: HEAT repeat domain-containing protein [Bacteroidota bacterium]